MVRSATTSTFDSMTVENDGAGHMPGTSLTFTERRVSGATCSVCAKVCESERRNVSVTVAALVALGLASAK